MIDIHTHIIPNIDDGSDDAQESIAQLRAMQDCGVRGVYLTSHYFRGHYQYSRDEYDAKFNALKQLADKEGLSIVLMPGFEIFLQSDILIDIKKHSLTMGHKPIHTNRKRTEWSPQRLLQQCIPLATCRLQAHSRPC